MARSRRRGFLFVVAVDEAARRSIACRTHLAKISLIFFSMFLMASKLDRMWSVPPSPHKIATVCVGSLIYLSPIHCSRLEHVSGFTEARVYRAHAHKYIHTASTKIRPCAGCHLNLTLSAMMQASGTVPALGRTSSCHVLEIPPFPVVVERICLMTVSPLTLCAKRAVLGFTHGRPNGRDLAVCRSSCKKSRLHAYIDFSLLPISP
jgi:hypothetical protein